MTVRSRTWRDRSGRAHTSYMIDIVHTHRDGTQERIRKTAPVQTRRAAEAYERQLRVELAQHEESEAHPPTTATRTAIQRREPIFREFVEEYLRDWAGSRNKPSVLQDKRIHLDRRLLPEFGDLRLSEINARAIERFKAGMLREGLARNTVNNHLITLGSILSVAVEWEILEKRPKIEKLPQTHRIDFLDFEEADRLIAAAEDAWRPMILFALRTGLRRGELLALRWEDVDLVVGKAVVRQAATRGVVGTPKSGRDREIPLSRETVAMLREHRHLRGPLVFCRDDGRMFDDDMVMHPLRRTCKKAGLRTIGWHTLRHSFASHLVMRGVPLRSVQELMGHASITTTMRYAHLAPQVNREAVELLDVRADAAHGTWTAHSASKKSRSS